jgi:nucleotide-binding universal stress UspA family protein
MTKPIIAAVDPSREDVAPAALGVVLTVRTIAVETDSAVTDRLLHGAPCPVVVAPAGYSLADAVNPQSIGVAFTDTVDGRAALAFAGNIAKAAEARIRVLMVAEPPDPLASLTVDTLGLDYVRLAHAETAKMAVERGVDELGGPASGETLSGDPADALAAASNHTNAATAR